MKCKVENMQNIKKIMEKRYEQKFFPKKTIINLPPLLYQYKIKKIITIVYSKISIYFSIY